MDRDLDAQITRIQEQIQQLERIETHQEDCFAECHSKLESKLNEKLGQREQNATLARLRKSEADKKRIDCETENKRKTAAHIASAALNQLGPDTASDTNQSIRGNLDVVSHHDIKQTDNALGQHEQERDPDNRSSPPTTDGNHLNPVTELGDGDAKHIPRDNSLSALVKHCFDDLDSQEWENVVQDQIDDRRYDTLFDAKINDWRDLIAWQYKNRLRALHSFYRDLQSAGEREFANRLRKIAETEAMYFQELQVEGDKF